MNKHNSNVIIKKKSQIYSIKVIDEKKIKGNIKSNKEEGCRATLTELRTRMNESLKCFNDIAQEKGVSNWLPYE